MISEREMVVGLRDEESGPINKIYPVGEKFTVKADITKYVSPDEDDVQTGQVIAVRPHRLIVPSMIAAYYMIHDIRVDDASQLAAPGAIPSAAFSELSIGTAMAMDTCKQTITLVVERFDVPKPNWFVRAIRRWLWIDNSQFEPKPFIASMICTMIYDDGENPAHPSAGEPGETTIGAKP